MRSFVVHFDDVAGAVNGKSEAMEKQLLDKFNEYGTVEPLEVYLAKHDEQWQNSVNTLKGEYMKLKEVACRNESEVAMIQTYRSGVKMEIAGEVAEKEKYRAELESNKEKLSIMKASISSILDK